MVPLASVVGRWTQAFVQVNYNSGNSAGAANSDSSIRVMVKDQNGNFLFNRLIHHDSLQHDFHDAFLMMNRYE